MNKKKLIFSEKVNKQFPVKAADLAKQIAKLHSIDGAEHIYISGLCFWQCVRSKEIKKRQIIQLRQKNVRSLPFLPNCLV